MSIALQPDGKVLIGGDFTSYNGIARERIARLHSDGNLDMSFQPGIGANDRVLSIATQPDGKIMLGGQFSSFNGTPRDRVARLHTDGSLDASFEFWAGSIHEINSIALQPDGRLLIGGAYFGNNNGCIARLNADGSLDATFSPGAGPDGHIRSLLLQTDGKILVGGNFTSYDGTGRKSIARLNADGSLDLSFDPGTGISGTIATSVQQPDGRYIIMGSFDRYDGTSRNGIARLNADASLDASFNPGTGANNMVWCIAIRPDQKLLIGGAFTSFNGTTRNGIARLDQDGSLDQAFDPGTGTGILGVNTVVVQADGRILIGGSFGNYDGTVRHGIARLHPDGGLDTSFIPSTNPSSSIHTMAVQPDGKILIGGYIRLDNDTTLRNLARLDPDGGTDPLFDIGDGIDGGVLSIALQPDGKVLIGGWFTEYDGISRWNIARANADGSPDISFDPGTGANSGVNCVALQPDGKVLIAGMFTGYDGTPRNRLARLQPDGTLDGMFDPGPGASSGIDQVVVQPDGKILIGGHFTSYHSQPRHRIARVNADGTLDSNFEPGNGADAVVRCIGLQADGNVLIGGSFTSYDGTGRNRIARIHGGLTTGVEVPSAQNGLGLWPNPAQFSTSIGFTLAEDSELTLTVIDAAGRSVKNLSLGHRTAGEHRYDLMVDDLGPGPYLLNLRTSDGTTSTSQLVVQ